MSERAVVRCEHCNLNQFVTASAVCRRCHKAMVSEEKPQPPALPVPVVSRDSLDESVIAIAVVDIRQARGLSQRQLAARMGVPRTYVSKLENGRLIPTLSTLDRLSKALKVDIATLITGNLSAVIMSDPFVVEIAQYAGNLTSDQRGYVINTIRNLAPTV